MAEEKKVEQAQDVIEEMDTADVHHESIKKDKKHKAKD